MPKTGKSIARSGSSRPKPIGWVFCTLGGLATCVPANAQFSRDASVLAAIRTEATERSQVMRTESELADGIGARLTGSPAFDKAVAWSTSKLRAMGTSVTVEDWGEFGLSWTQVGAAVTFEDPGGQVVDSQAVPWSSATSGRVLGDAVTVPLLRDDADLAHWSGRLRGRIVLYGNAPTFDPDSVPLFVRENPETLKRWSEGHDGPDQTERNRTYYRAANFDERVDRFFRDEGVLAVLKAGGEDGALRIDETAMMGWRGYMIGKRPAVPSAVISSEGYGRAARLLAKGEKVRIGVDVRVATGAERAHGYNVIAEIPGSDPALADQVVMLGAHLDSWPGANGATDDGAGVAVAIEALRILKAVGAHPRRTIRIGLWGGEEQGELGSLAYVKAHLGEIRFQPTSNGEAVPFSFAAVERASPGAEAARMKAYFNMDHGAGRLLGVALRGNAVAAHAMAGPASSLSDLGFTAVSTRSINQTDSAFFALLGVPTLDFYQPARDDDLTHHTTLDTLERVQETDMIQAATVAASLLYMVAQDDAPMRAVPAHP